MWNAIQILCFMRHFGVLEVRNQAPSRPPFRAIQSTGKRVVVIELLEIPPHLPSPILDFLWHIKLVLNLLSSKIVRPPSANPDSSQQREQPSATCKACNAKKKISPHWHSITKSLNFTTDSSTKDFQWLWRWRNWLHNLKKKHLLQAIDHKVHHLHIPGETLGDMGNFYRVPKCLVDEGKVWGRYDSFPQGKTIFTDSENDSWLIDKNPSKSIKTSLTLKISYEFPTVVKASQTAWPNVFPSTPVMTLVEVNGPPMASWGCWQNAPREVVESQTPSTCWVSNGSNLIVTKIHIYWLGSLK